MEGRSSYRGRSRSRSRSRERREKRDRRRDDHERRRDRSNSRRRDQRDDGEYSRRDDRAHKGHNGDRNGRDRDHSRERFGRGNNESNSKYSSVKAEVVEEPADPITSRKNQTVESKNEATEPRWGKKEEYEDLAEEGKEPAAPVFKPDFGLSGALAKDERTGNMVNGVVLKFTEPFEAAQPDKNWRLYVYKGEELVETLHIHRRSCFLVGRDDRVADIKTLNPSCSLQHAVIQFRSVEKREMVDGERVTVTSVKPYIMDLQSTHGTFLNGSRIDDSRYYELLEGDVLKFGGSPREYVLLHAQSGKD